MKQLYIWGAISAVVIAATVGDVMQAYAMRKIGDLGQLRRSHGLLYVIRRVLTSGPFMFGLLFMAIAFFSLLLAFSWGPLSLVGPATASLTYITNAIAARIFLKENVDARRCVAALFVAGGVFLLAY